MRVEIADNNAVYYENAFKKYNLEKIYIKEYDIYEYYIEIESLEQLEKLSRDIGEAVILKIGWYLCKPYLEVYNPFAR